MNTNNNKAVERACCSVLACLFAGTLALPAQNKVADPEEMVWSKNSARPVMAEGYQEEPFSYAEVRPGAILADRMELSLTKLIKDKEKLTGYATWGADQIGRWIGAVSVEAATTGKDIASHLKPKVQELIAAQDAHGIFYGAKLAADPSQDNKLRVWFGQARALWNLQEYWRITRDVRTLAALRHAADITVAHQDELKQLRTYWGDRKTPWAINCGIESSLGAMIALGQELGKPEYIAYGRYIADNIPQEVSPPSDVVLGGIAPSTNLVSFKGIPFGHHTHSFLSIAHGLVDLSIATHASKYLDEAKNTFEETLPSLWIDGNIPEGYGQLYEHRDEMCSTVDWILLCLKLFDATGQARYLDVAELSILNQLLFGQDHGGGFTCYRSIDRHHWMDTNNWGSVADWCCTMHGGVVLGQVATHIVTRSQQGLSVNLPLAVDIQTQRNSRSMRLSQHIRINSSDLVQTLKISNSDETPLALSIRIPYWCEQPKARVDGVKRELNVVNGFASLSCKGRSEQTVELTLPMKLVIIPPRRNIFTLHGPPVPGEATEEGMQYGPFVLMFSREMFPSIKDRDLSVILPLDRGRPTVSQEAPGWRVGGAIPLFIKAKLSGKSEVSLTPCANAPMLPFTVADPYVMRFASVSVGD